MKKRILCMAMVLCMVIALLPVTAFAALDSYPGMTVTIKSQDGASTKLTFVRGEDYVIVTDENGKLFSHGVNASGYHQYCVNYKNNPDIDWNIRIQYTDDGLVITLRNAYVKCNEAYANLFTVEGGAPLKIVLEGTNIFDNYYPSENKNWLGCGDSQAAMCLKATKGTTITGTGSLTVSSAGHITNSVSGTGTMYGAAVESYYDLTIRDATFTAKMRENKGAYGTQTIRCSGNLLIDNAKVEVVADTYGSAIWLGTPRTNLDTTGKNVTIQNGAKVTCSTKSTSESRHAITVGNGDIIIDAANGTEVTLQAIKKAFSKDPVITGNYTAVAGTSADAATEYVAGGTYKYFHLEGAPAVPTFDASAVEAGNDLSLWFRINKTATDAAAGTQVKMERTGFGGAAQTTYIPLTSCPVREGFYEIPYTGIAAKEMADTITMTVCDANGVAVSDTKSDSVLEYAKRMLGGADDKLNTLVADMLIYGAMAQDVFNHNEGNLVTTDLDLSAATTEMLATPTTPATATGIKHLGTTFELNNNIAMLIAVEGEVTAVEVYVAGAKSNVAATFTTVDGYSIITFNGLNAADGRKEVKFEINGDTSMTVTDSLAGYVGRNIEQYSYLASLMNYCDSAAAYFAAK